MPSVVDEVLAGCNVVAQYSFSAKHVSDDDAARGGILFKLTGEGCDPGGGLIADSVDAAADDVLEVECKSRTLGGFDAKAINSKGDDRANEVDLRVGKDCHQVLFGKYLVEVGSLEVPPSRYHVPRGGLRSGPRDQVISQFADNPFDLVTIFTVEPVHLGGIDRFLGGLEQMVSYLQYFGHRFTGKEVILN